MVIIQAIEFRSFRYPTHIPEVQSCRCSPEWSGRRLSEFVPMEYAIPVAMARNGKGILPRGEMILEPQDILQVSSLPEGVKLLRERIHENGNGHREE